MEARMNELAEQQELMFANGLADDRRRVLLVLQGMDTSGKDGTIRAVLADVNPQSCAITAFKAPSSEEMAHDFLCASTRPSRAVGQVGVFNRSHYEDVLIARVRSLATPEVIRRRRAESSTSSASWSTTRSQQSILYVYIAWLSVLLGRRPSVELTSHEYRLLSYLMHHAGRIVSRGELTEHLFYDQDFDRDSNTIEVFVGRLRKKLGVDVIQTVRGFGYLVDPKSEDDQRRA